MGLVSYLLVIYYHNLRSYGAGMLTVYIYIIKRLKMQALGSFDILVNSYQTTWRHIPKDSSLRAYMVKFVVRSSSLRTLYTHPTRNEYF